MVGSNDTQLYGNDTASVQPGIRNAPELSLPLHCTCISKFIIPPLACAVLLEKLRIRPCSTVQPAHAADNPTFGLGIKSEEKNAEIWGFYFGNVVVCNRPFGLGIVSYHPNAQIIPHARVFRKGDFL